MSQLGRFQARISCQMVVLERMLGRIDCIQIVIGNVWVSLIETSCKLQTQLFAQLHDDCVRT